MVKIKNKKSTLADFIRRPIPTDKEIEQFDEYIDNKVRKEEIQESLTEIYRGEDGKIIDVSRLETRKKHGWLFRIFISLMVLLFLGLVGYAYYYFVFSNQFGKNSTLNINLAAAEETVAGKEFFYILELNNKENVALTNMEIKIRYPEGFIFLDSEPKTSSSNDTWNIPNLATRASQQIKIKGKIILPANKTAVAFADVTYVPENFSSQFKKTTTSEINVEAIGMDIAVEKSSLAFIGEENKITLSIKPREDVFINNFLVTLEVPENFTVMDKQNLPEKIEQKANKKNVFIISELSNEEISLPISFNVEEKTADKQSVNIKFEFAEETATGVKYHTFYEEAVEFETTVSDLNLNLFVNGSQSNQGVNQGDTINYLLNYANKGDSDLENVVIMLVIEGGLVDWQSFNGDIRGAISGNTISWSKLEIPELENLAKGAEGSINLSFTLKSADQATAANDSIQSYAQFSAGDKEAGSTSTNKSNTIINQINSDLSFTEELKYFNNDNIAVGSGPLPPKVNETTSFKVYWTIENNLHELIGLQVNLPLPAYIMWDEKNQASVGQLTYDREEHRVNWWIGRLPTTVYQATAEFNISFTPTENNKNKIAVLLPGTTATAVDNETKTNITITTKAQTTQLKDDLIADTDGIVK
jgi:hypothetical protein